MRSIEKRDILIITLAVVALVSGSFLIIRNLNKQFGWQVAIPENYQEAMRLTLGDYTLAIKPLAAQASPVKRQGGGKYKYGEAYAQTDVISQRQASRLKEDIILKAPGHPSEFFYQLNLDEFYYKIDHAGNLNIYPKGYENKRGPLYSIFTIPAPFLVDADGNQSSVGDVEMTVAGNILALRPSPDWLDNHQYPIILDPTVEIHVLNVQSYPLIGGEWEVDFTTVGEADLKIEALTDDEYTTVFDEDVGFISLTCGQEESIPTREGEVYVYENWSCDELAMFKTRVLIGGKHHLQFQFGEQKADAFNTNVSPIEPVTVVDIAPGTAGSWQTVDLSSYIPAGAEGICFETIIVPLLERSWGIRHGDSTDNFYGGNEDQAHHWGCIGVNANREVDIIVEDTGIVIDLVSYIPDGYGEFLTNAVDHSTGSTVTWVDVDVSADFSGGTCAVTFFQLDIHEAFSEKDFGARVNGRTNTQYYAMYGGHPDETSYFGMMGLDGSEIFEQQIESTTVDLYVNGCLYAGDGVHVETDTNPTEYSTGTTGSYQDTTITIAQADNATGVFFVNGCNNIEYEHGIRRNGETTDYWGNYDMKHGAWGWVATDASQVIEQRIENITCDLWVWGWTWQVSVANSAPTITAVSDSPDPVAAGADVTFTVDWNDADAGEMVKAHICQTDAISGGSCTGGSWCDSPVFTNRDPEVCTGTTAATDASSTPYTYYTFVCDDGGTCSTSTSSTLSITQQSPTAPTALLTENLQSPAYNISTTTPKFSAIFNDPNPYDYMKKHCIQVNTASDFSSTNMWYSDSNSCLTGVTTTLMTSGWWNSSWTKRRKITFDTTSSATTTDLTNYPTAIQFNSSRINYSNTQDSGQDIRFVDADGSTELNYEIEQWNESGTSTVWVQVPTITANSSTDYIWLYYRNSSATDNATTTGVWDDNYVMVRHYGETSVSYLDSTAYGNDTTNFDTSTADGKLGRAVSDTNTNLSVAEAANQDGMSQLTLEAWVNMNAINTTNGDYIFRKHHTVSPWDSYSMRVYTSGEVVVNIRDSGGGSNSVTSVTNLSTSTWYYLSGVYNGSIVQVYVNAVADDPTPASMSGTVFDSDSSLGGPDYDSPDGTFDEFRISKIARSLDWLEFSYCSMDDGCTTYGSEEAQYSSAQSGQRSEDITYAGTALSLDGTTYYWRMWFWDNSDNKSATSTTASFTMASGAADLPRGVRWMGGRIKGGIRLK